MGRKPLPPEERKLRGSRQRKKAPPPAATPSDIAAPPSWLTDELACSEWNRLVPELTKMRVLSPMDSVNLAMLCQATSVYVRSQRTICEKGSTYTTQSKHGEMDRVRPEVKIAAEAEKTILRITKEFGLAPLSRARMASAHASNGVQLELPNFGTSVTTQASTSPHDIAHPQDRPAASTADEFFGYGGGSGAAQVH